MTQYTSILRMLSSEERTTYNILSDLVQRWYVLEIMMIAGGAFQIVAAIFQYLQGTIKMPHTPEACQQADAGLGALILALFVCGIVLGVTGILRILST
jgi:hypothetical protein